MRERSPKAKKVWLSILVVTWPFVCTFVHTSVATLISMLWSTDSCQNKVFADQYHMTVLQVQFSTHQVYVFFLSYPLDFNWSQAQLQMDFFAMVTSLLLEVNYKFISGSFGRKPWLNLFYIKGGGGPIECWKQFCDYHQHEGTLLTLKNLRYLHKGIVFRGEYCFTPEYISSLASIMYVFSDWYQERFPNGTLLMCSLMRPATPYNLNAWSPWRACSVPRLQEGDS